MANFVFSAIIADLEPETRLPIMTELLDLFHKAVVSLDGTKIVIGKQRRILKGFDALALSTLIGGLDASFQRSKDDVFCHLSPGCETIYINGRVAIDAKDRNITASASLSSRSCEFLHALSKSSSHFQGVAGLSVRGVPFQRVRPPKNYRIVGSSSIVDIVDRRGFYDERARADYDKLAGAELPAETRRTVIGDAMVIDWFSGQDLSQSRLAACLSKRDHWLSELNLGTIAEGWTELGDAIVDPISAKPHPEFALFSSLTSVGYVAIHSALPVNEQRRMLQKAGAIMAAGKTSTGEPVINVIVIADSRKAAEDLRSEALSSGIKTVTYATDDHLLDPFPDGFWINDREVDE
jgi:hypothetical protein